MFIILWLLLWIVSRWIVLRECNLPGIQAIVPFLGGFSLAKSVGRSDIAILRILSEFGAIISLFLAFGAAGNFHIPAVDALIDFIELDILGGTSITAVDVFVALLLVFLVIYLITHATVSASITRNWGFSWPFTVVLTLFEPIGLTIMALGPHKPLVKY